MSRDKTAGRSWSAALLGAAAAPAVCRGRGPGRHEKTTRKAGPRPMLTIILIVVVLLLLFGGFGYSRRGRGV
jgi:hypothetical protein